MSLTDAAGSGSPLLWVEPGSDVSPYAPASPADVVSAWLPDVPPGPDLARVLAQLADPSMVALFAVADPARGEPTRLAPKPEPPAAGGVGVDRPGTVWDVAGVTPDTVAVADAQVTLVQGWDRLISWATAGRETALARAYAALTALDPPGGHDRWAAAEAARAELAAALHVNRPAIGGQIERATRLVTHLPGTLALLAAGRIPVEATPYSVSKTALNMLTVHQQAQLRAQGSEVVVVAIDPGHVKTEMGGPHAVVEPEDSVKGVLGVLGRVGAEEGGRFWAFDGAEVPW